MAGFLIKPLLEDDLPEAAKFLQKQQEIAFENDPNGFRPLGDDMRWVLGNPDLPRDSSLGLMLRTTEGEFKGMILGLPRSYWLEGRRLLGLAAGNFYVDPSARMQGFFMLRRFLAAPGVDFWYANSCNEQSGGLWAKCGGVMVSESETEYLLPFRFNPLFEEMAIRKKWPRAMRQMLSLASPIAGLLSRLRRPKNSLKVEACDDLERLARVAEVDRNTEYLETDRSVPYLQWLYGNAKSAGPEPARRIHRFWDNQGNEGWFLIDYSRRGKNQQIFTARLQDVVWPHTKLGLTAVLAAIIETVAPHADLLSIRGRVSMKLNGSIPGVNRRTLPAAEGFVFSKDPTSSDLARVADFPFSDRY